MAQSIDKEQKYDRQLRLWGREGQQALENSNICVLGSNAAATETLKNLVLPGVGRFTIVDSKKVEPRDLGSNFFLVKESIGRSRAAETAKLLHELNDDVASAEVVDKDPVDLINNEPEFFKKFTLVVACDLIESALLKLDKICSENSIPLVVVTIYGFVASLRLFHPEHCVVESKPDFPKTDALRVREPFPELRAYADTWNFDTLTTVEHAHIPFPVILIKAADAWKASHGGNLPLSKETKEFKSTIAKMMWKPEEENFDEAMKNFNLLQLSDSIPQEVLEVINDPKADPSNITAASTNFWILASALKMFVDNEGRGKLPVNGSIPDMTAETKNYIALQNVYKNKADADVAALRAHAQALLKKVGKDTASITDDEVISYAKNAAVLRVLRFRSLTAERDPKTPIPDLETMTYGLEDTKENAYHWYFLLRAVERFRVQHGHFPAHDVNSTTWEDDIAGVKQIVQALLEENGIEKDKISDDHIVEIVRYGGSQLHTLGAIIGGISAQEIIKLITRQWLPLYNTFVFNGLDSYSTSFQA